jgi:hypothetical protein
MKITHIASGTAIENKPLKTFRELENEAHSKGEHHHYRYHCAKCGKTETCRCPAPKTDIVGICPFCEEGIPNDGRDRLHESLKNFTDKMLGKGKDEPKSKPCPKCGGNAHVRHNHEDTDMEELVWRCDDCRNEEPI